MNVFNYYLHNFALSLYVCPDNKVKSNLVMVFGVDLILFPHFYYHAFVSEKSSDLDRFVVTEIYVLQSIPYFQSFQIVIVVADVAVCKGGIQRSLMYILRDFLVRFKRLFGWSSDLFLFGQMRTLPVRVWLPRLCGKRKAQTHCHGYGRLRPRLQSCPLYLLRSA